MDRGAWQATVHGVAESQTRLKWLSTHAPVTVGIKNKFRDSKGFWIPLCCELSSIHYYIIVPLVLDICWLCDLKNKSDILRIISYGEGPFLPPLVSPNYCKDEASLLRPASCTDLRVHGAMFGHWTLTVHSFGQWLCLSFLTCKMGIIKPQGAALRISGDDAGQT